MIRGLLERASIVLMNSFSRTSQLGVTDPGKIHPSAKLEHAYVVGDVEIGRNVTIRRGVTLSGKITVGAYTSINGPNTDIHCEHLHVSIGKFCSIARNVSIQEYYHHTDRLSTTMIHAALFGKPTKEDSVSKGPIVVGNDVWIAAHSVVLSGVTIGHGAVVAANSVVNQHVPDYAIVAGSPARVVRYRFDPDTIAALLHSAWWDWDDDKLRANVDLFLSPVDADLLRRVAGA